MTGRILFDQPTDRKRTEALCCELDLPSLVDGKPELPPRPNRHSFAWDLVELFMRHMDLDGYGDDKHSIPSKVFKLARAERVTWAPLTRCTDGRGVYQGVKVKFMHPTDAFLSGLSDLDFPIKGMLVLSQVHPRWDLSYDPSEAARANLQWDRGLLQKYNRRVTSRFELSSYGGTRDDSRNRDVYLKTNTLVRIEPRIQKPAAVRRLDLHDPATLASYRPENFVALFDRLLSWRPVTMQHAERITRHLPSHWHVERTLCFVEHGWVHGREKLSVSQMMSGWDLEPSVDGVLVHRA